MNFLFDIGHPAHVHYFKNLIWALKKKGHEIKITTRDKEISLYLLNKYGFEYICTGQNKSTILGKASSLIKNDYIIYKEAKKFNPNILISFFLPFTAHVGSVLRKPVIGFTDTEHATSNILLAEKFTNIIVTPKCYKRNFPKNKHIRFSGNFELASLHPNYFKPDNSIIDYLGVKKYEKYVIVRFVSRTALHDIGHRGLSLNMKRKAVKTLSKYAKIFVTSEEGKLPDDLKQYQIKIPPEKMHDALYYATMYFGEGGTMATESAVLGVPTIRIPYLAVPKPGNFIELEKAGLVYNFTDTETALEKGIEILCDSDSKKKWNEKKEKLLKSKIDPTAFMVWLIENYPNSIRIMKENPDYQFNFK